MNYCENCKWFREKAGVNNLGLCTNYKSNKKMKDLIFKKDTCKKWEAKDGIKQKRFN